MRKSKYYTEWEDLTENQKRLHKRTQENIDHLLEYKADEDKCPGCVKAENDAWIKTYKAHERVMGYLGRPAGFGVGWKCEICDNSGITN